MVIKAPFSCSMKSHLQFSVHPGNMEYYQDARLLALIKEVIGDASFFSLESPFSFSRISNYVRNSRGERWSFSNRVYCDYKPKNVQNDNLFDLRNSDETAIARIERGLYYTSQYHIKNESLICPKLIFANEDGIVWDAQKIHNTLIRLAKAMVEAKPSTVEQDSTAFDGLFYANDLLDDIKTDFENFLNSRDLYKELELPWKRGYVFVGSSGNGKTSVIRALCKYYGLESKKIVECLTLSGEVKQFSNHRNFLDYYLFPTKRDVIAILLEDIDKFTAYQCESNNSDFAKVSLHTILNAIDGVESYDGVVLFATSNHPGSIAESLLARPGRFDRVWTFNDPTQKEIIALLNYRKIKISDTPLEVVAKELNGYSMAFVEEFVKSVKMTYCKPIITYEEANSVLNRIHAHKSLFERHFSNERKRAGFLQN